MKLSIFHGVHACPAVAQRMSRNGEARSARRFGERSDVGFFQNPAHEQPAAWRRALRHRPGSRASRILRLMLAAMKSVPPSGDRPDVAQQGRDRVFRRRWRGCFRRSSRRSNSSMSTASTVSAPCRAATMANTPVPLPISRPRNPVTSRSSNPEAIRQVVAWRPVPNDILGMMTTSASVAAGAWNGARIVSRPSTSTGREAAFPQGVPILRFDAQKGGASDAVKRRQQRIHFAFAVGQPLLGDVGFQP